MPDRQLVSTCSTRAECAHATEGASETDRGPTRIANVNGRVSPALFGHSGISASTTPQIGMPSQPVSNGIVVFGLNVYLLGFQHRTLNTSDMTPPTKSQNPKQTVPDIHECSETVLVAAIIVKLTGQRGEKFTRVGPSDVSKMILALRKYPAAVRREQSKKFVAIHLKLAPEKRISLNLPSSGLDAVSYFSGNPGKLTPLIMKACERVNNAGFEQNVKSLVGEIKVGQLPPGKASKLSVKGNVISLY